MSIALFALATLIFVGVVKGLNMWCFIAAYWLLVIIKNLNEHIRKERNK